MSTVEADQVDPQQMLILELTHEALEDAGLPTTELAGQRVGVFIGVSFGAHANIRSGDLPAADGYFVTGGALSILANRVSHAFDFRGPSLIVDTACSSSLVALDLACKALQRGEIDTAIVGASNLLLESRTFVPFALATMLSPTGRCRPFSADADGFLRGEGAAVLVLRRQKDVTADDRPLGWVLGTGVNSDGATVGLAMPNGAAQACLLGEVYDKAGVSFDDIDYFEAHGTGTQVGDPIEARAIGTALAQKRDLQLLVGSSKSNFGHLESASGMLGLFSGLAALNFRCTPKLAHFAAPNVDIDFASLNIVPCGKSHALRSSGRLVVGVNSFGFGGTNAHAILSSEPLEPSRSRASPGARLRKLPPLLLSARTTSALVDVAGAWAKYLACAPEDRIGEAIRGAARARTHYAHRLVARGATGADIAETLRSWIKGAPSTRIQTGLAGSGDVVFVFSGNGAQWPGMGKLALRLNADFRKAIRSLDARMKPRLGWSIEAELQAADPDRLAATDIAQPLLFAIQYALVECLRNWDIKPTAVVGYSVGEIASAWCAGAISLDTAIDIVICRSELQHRTRGRGQMAVCGLDATEARRIIGQQRLRLDIGALNTAHSVTLSGTQRDISLVGEVVAAKGHFFKVLDLDYAFHSRLLNPLREELQSRLRTVEFATPVIDFYSTVTGRRERRPKLDAKYWWRNLRDPVKFSAVVAELGATDLSLCVELGPHPVLLSSLAPLRDNSRHLRHVIGSLSRNQVDGDPIERLIGECHCLGAGIQHSRAFDGPRTFRSLPFYPYQRKTLGGHHTIEGFDPKSIPATHPLLGRPVSLDATEWRNFLDRELHPWLADHAVDGVAILPAAAMIDMVFAAARAREPKATAFEILDFEIYRPLHLEPGATRETRVRMGLERDLFEIASRPRLQDVPWTIHAVGKVSASPPIDCEMPDLDKAGGATIDMDWLYAHGRRLGLDYGPCFALVRSVQIYGDNLVSVSVAPADAASAQRAAAGCLIDAARLDATFHGLLAMPISRDAKRLPRRVGRVRLNLRYGTSPARALVSLLREGPDAAEGKIIVVDEIGDLLLEMSECWFVRAPAPGALDPGFWKVDHPPLSSTAIPAHPLAMTNAAPAETRLLMEDLITTGIVGALAELDIGDIVDPEALAVGRKIEREGTFVLERLMHALAKTGQAITVSQGWRLTLAAKEPSGWSDTWLRLRAKLPAAAAEVALTGVALSCLVRNLRRPGGPERLPDGLIHQAMTDGPDGIALIEALARYGAELISAAPSGCRLNVLDIGAASGLVAEALAARLGAIPAGLTLTVAAGSIEQADRAAPTLTRTPGQTTVWKPGGVLPVALQGQRFDIVLVSHPASLSDDPAAIRTALAQVLAPEALVIIAEPAPSLLWTLLLSSNADTSYHTQASWLSGLEQVSESLVHGTLWDFQLRIARAPKAKSAATSDHHAPLLIVAAGDAGLANSVASRARQHIDHSVCVATEHFVEMLSNHRGDVVVMAGDPVDPAPLLAMIASLNRALDEDRIGRIVIVTRGERHGEVAAQAVESVARVLGNETRSLIVRVLRLSRSLDEDSAVQAITSALSATDPETEQNWSGDGVTTTRVRPFTPGLTAPTPSMLAMTHRGRIDGVAWQAFAPREPGPGEISIEIEAVGLNFRDVMWILGLLPDEALLDGFAGPTLGLECAGRVTGIGSGVTRLSIGDRVMALAPASLATQTITPEAACVRLSDDMTPEAAATLPVAFMTVVYSLGRLARLLPGETILIHGAAGGVGLAAVQYARHKGARIIATAGSPAKREYLHLLGVESVLDSRSLAFTDNIRRLTAGRGVDVVLNSLAGPAMVRSLEILAPGGRFIELGKRDFYADTAVGLRPLRRNIAYFGVDIDSIARHQPDAMAALFSEISGLMEQGHITPLPYRAASFAQVTDAFRQMRDGGHIGKLVLSRARGLPQTRVATRSFEADAAGTYVIVGGMTGFGLETARWLVSRGARHLALISRRGAETPDAAESLAELGSHGCSASAYSCDASDRAQLENTLALIRVAQPPIVGIVQSAMVLHDGMLATMDEQAFRDVLKPKYQAAVWLDELTRSDPLSLFLVYSSISTLLANPGQAPYVAANAGLEALVERRRADGRPGLAVAWGPIADSGVLTRESATAEIVLRHMGSNLLKTAQALDSLDILLREQIGFVAVAQMRWREARTALRGITTARFSEVIGQAGVDERKGPSDVREAIAAMPQAEALALVLDMLIETLAITLRLSPECIRPATRMNDLGLDSLLGMTLGLAIEERFKVALGRVSLAEQTTVEQLARSLLRALGAKSSEQPEVLEI